MPCSTIALTRALATAALAAPVLFSQLGNGRLKANIGDESGKPLAQAVVVYRRIRDGMSDSRGRFQETPGQAHIAAQIAADANGVADTPLLPPGNYILCVQAAGYLTSCNWSGWHTAMISGGNDHDFGRIVLKKAAPVTVRINDPQALLPRDPKTLGLVVGIFDDENNFHGPDQSAVSTGGRDVQIGVPYGRTMQLWIHSRKYRLTDSNNAALNSDGTRIPFHATQGLPAAFTINVVGPR